ncbi:hypothetical protein OSTOST_00818, partial [Ostertagia ostertagi]
QLPPREESNRAENERQVSRARYNLRPRRGPNLWANQITTSIGSAPLILAILLSLMCVGIGANSSHETHSSDISITRHIRCIQGGVEIIAPEGDPYEICVEGSCTTFTKPRAAEIIRFEPQVVLHEHEVRWKFIENALVKAIEITCPAAPFREVLSASLCSAAVFNPECWPRSAIAVTALFLYCLIAGCYVLLYVPVVIGRPVRIVASCLVRIPKFCVGRALNSIGFGTNQRRQGRRRDIAELLAIVTLGWVDHFDAVKGRARSYFLYMHPNMPNKLGGFKFTLASITVPPIPLLSTRFVTDGIGEALWHNEIKSPLLFPNRTAAENLWCEINDDCQCYPAVIKVNCRCKQVNISARFTNLQHYLPIATPSVILRSSNGGVQAKIPVMTTSEITLSIDDRLETTVIVQDSVCSIENAELPGCYNCAKGAVTQVRCTAPKQSQAEVRCDQSSFSILCDEKGIATSLRFSFNKARVFLKCSVSCRKTISSFELSGILNFAHTTHGMMSMWMSGSANDNSELQWTDFGHILDVFTHWYKTVITAIFLVGILVFCTFIPLHLWVTPFVVYHKAGNKIPTTLANTYAPRLVSKEIILRMGTRYVLSDLLYHHQVQGGRLSQRRRDEWLRAAHEHDVRSYQVLALTDEWTRRMERDYWRNEDNTGEISQLKEQVEALTMNHNTERPIAVENSSQDDTSQVSHPEENEDDYWVRMVREVTDPEEPAAPAKGDGDNSGPRRKCRKEEANKLSPNCATSPIVAE